MKKRILILNCSLRGDFSATGKPIEIPRPGGIVEPVPAVSCCGRMAASFAEEAEKRGAETVRLNLHELRHVGPCRACYGCLKGGTCVIDDDMQKIYPELDRADAVLFVSPLYYATLPAQALAVINRLYPYWIDGIRYPKYKAVGVIGLCADLGQDWTLFDATWKSICGEIGWPLVGIVHAPRFMEHVDASLAQARAFAEKFIC